MKYFVQKASKQNVWGFLGGKKASQDNWVRSTYLHFLQQRVSHTKKFTQLYVAG